MSDYYEKIALTHEELRAIIKRSSILMCMPNQHAALMKSYDDLRKVAESLDMSILHLEKEKRSTNTKGDENGKESSH